MSEKPQLEARNDAERKCVESLKEKFPVEQHPEEDKHFLENEMTYVRFARARKGNVEKATAMLQECIDWRKEYKPYEITREQVEPIMQKGLTTVGGFCNEGRPILIIRLGLANEFTTEDRVKQLVFLMEEIQRKGYETATWIVDFTHLGEKKEKDPYTQETRKITSHITQDFYPERLGKMYLYHGPWYLNMLITLAKPFIDSNTRDKIYKAGGNLEELGRYVRSDQLPASMGGSMSDNALDNLDKMPSYSASLVESIVNKTYFTRSATASAAAGGRERNSVTKEVDNSDIAAENAPEAGKKDDSTEMQKGDQDDSQKHEKK